MKRLLVGMVVIALCCTSAFASRDVIIFQNARSDIADPIIAALSGGSAYGGMSDTTGRQIRDTSSFILLLMRQDASRLDSTHVYVYPFGFASDTLLGALLNSLGDTFDLLLRVNSLDSPPAALSTGHATETTLLDILRKLDTDVIATILQYGQATETTLLNIYNKLSDTARVTVLNNIMDTMRIFGQVRTVIDSIVVTETKAPRQERVVVDSASTIGDTDFRILAPSGDTIIGFTCTTSAYIITLDQNVEWLMVTTDSSAWFRIGGSAVKGIGGGSFPVSIDRDIYLRRRVLSGTTISAIAENDSARIGVWCGIHQP